jgi:hypothetical protein
MLAWYDNGVEHMRRVNKEGERMTFNFQVGDVVKFHREYLDEMGEETDVTPKAGERAVVVGVGHRIGGRKWLNYLVTFDDGAEVFVRSKWIYLCEECNQDKAVPTNKSRQYGVETEQDMGVLGSAVDKVRQLAMSSDDRLLRKYYIVDECGNVTPEGKALLLELLFADNKAAVVAKLTEIESEEDKKSKKK